MPQKAISLDNINPIMQTALRPFIPQPRKVAADDVAALADKLDEIKYLYGKIGEAIKDFDNTFDRCLIPPGGGR